MSPELRSIATRLTGLGLVVLGLLAAELLFRLGAVSPYVLPPPLEMLRSAADLCVSEGLVTHFLTTTMMTLASLSLALVVGLPLGWLLAREPLLGNAYGTWLGAAFSAPVILLYPLFLVLFGRGILTIIIMGAVIGFIPITLKTLEGFRAVPRVLLNVALSLKMTERQTVLQVLIPAALPTIFTGIRLALIYVMINIIALEFLLSMGGLGYLVAEMYDRFDVPSTYAAIVFVVLCTILFFECTERLETWLTAR